MVSAPSQVNQIAQQRLEEEHEKQKDNAIDNICGELPSLQLQDLQSLTDIVALSALGRKAYDHYLAVVLRPLLLIEKEHPGLTVADVIKTEGLHVEPVKRYVKDVYRQCFEEILKSF